MSFLSWLITTSSGDKEVTTPISWEGHEGKGFVTLKQYIELTQWDGSDLVKLFSILSGLSVKALNDTYDPALFEQLEISTRFIYDSEPTFKRAEKPKTIIVNGKTLHVPFNLKGLSIGQSILVRQAIDQNDTYDACIPMALACYFQPQYDNTNEFNSNRALELLPYFEAMPVTEAYGIGFFLLKPLMRRGKTIGESLRLLITRCLSHSSKREAR